MYGENELEQGSMHKNIPLNYLLIIYICYTIFISPNFKLKMTSLVYSKNSQYSSKFIVYCQKYPGLFLSLKICGYFVILSVRM